MEPIKRFCTVLRKRSLEHKLAMNQLHELPGVMASILRQELDSMIRVIFLLSLSDLNERKRLIEKTFNGEVWTSLTNKGKYKKVTDRDMVEISDKLQGWTYSVYKFGCSFIHFSNYHDYSNENPFKSLSEEEQSHILKHMRDYHGGPSTDSPTFNDIAIYFPQIFDKIAGNLECYIKDLEENKVNIPII